MTPRVSIIIPNRNGSATIGRCLEAALASRYADFEVIVVDDDSADGSVDIIGRFPCRLVRLTEHCGAAQARNVGARHSQGEVLFFTDADCLVNADALQHVMKALASAPVGTVVGGTYTRRPADDRFFSRFQSVFIHYSETKNLSSPDYVATHAMAMTAETFHRAGGFKESLRPMLEDVEFSHRVRRRGGRLVMNPRLQVRHVFGFSMVGSLRNAWRKSMHWTMYSLRNKDLFKDSGTASLELKTNVGLYFLNLLLFTLYVVTARGGWLVLLAGSVLANIVVNRGLLRAFVHANGAWFSLWATAYYLGVYPLPVGIGAMTGVTRWCRRSN